MTLFSLFTKRSGAAPRRGHPPRRLSISTHGDRFAQLAVRHAVAPTLVGAAWSCCAFGQVARARASAVSCVFAALGVRDVRVVDEAHEFRGRRGRPERRPPGRQATSTPGKTSRGHPPLTAPCRLTDDLRTPTSHWSRGHPPLTAPAKKITLTPTRVTVSVHLTCHTVSRPSE